MALPRMSRARLLLPEAVTMLGIPGQMVLWHPGAEAFFTWDPPADSILCSSGDGYEMFLLRPIADAGRPKRLDVTLHVDELWEEFHNRALEGHYNAFCPAFKRPKLRGQVAVIQYAARKDLDEESTGAVVPWVHHFDPESYPELWSVGADQYFIPRGAWRITARGITNDGE